MTGDVGLDSISHATNVFPRRLSAASSRRERSVREDDPRRTAAGKRSRGIFSLMICTLRAKIAQQSPSCARSSATFHPPAVRRLTVRPPRPCSRSLARCCSLVLLCVSTRNFPFFFIILFIFLANHSDPAAVCLPMQMQRVGASCSPVSSVSVSPTLATFYNTGPPPRSLSLLPSCTRRCLNIISN